MFYLNPTSPEIKDACDFHTERIRCFVNKKIGGPKCNIVCDICRSNLREIAKLNPSLKNYLLDPVNLELIISSEPSELMEIYTDFWRSIFPAFNFNDWKIYFNRKNIATSSTSAYKAFSTILFENYIDSLNKIFDYDWFSKKNSKYYSAYDLVKKLDRNSCTYCNRIYTSTIIKNGERIMRPTLDHWFPKSDFPLLALSFYNLIPSCTNCNSSVKGATNFTLTDYIHPYRDVNQNEDFSFNYAYNSLSSYRIFLQDTIHGKSKATNTLKGMYIDEIYNSHQSEISDLIKIKINYSKSYIGSIEKLFGNKLAKEEVYRILFGVEYDTKDFHKLPLSKFKSDILKKLKII